MKRKEVFKEFLKVIFGATTIKPTAGKIYRAGNLFSECNFNDEYMDLYVKLLRIAFLDISPKEQRVNYEPTEFPRLESISRFYNYLRSYKADIRLPEVNETSSRGFAYKAALEILSVIFFKSNESDRFNLENEDISIIFRNALDRIQYSYNNSQTISNLINNYSSCIYDAEFNKERCNYSISVETGTILDDIMDLYSPILLKIYLSKTGKYDKQSPFFFNKITRLFDSDNDKKNINSEEIFLYKPLALSGFTIDIPPIFEFYTYLDEKIIIKNYKCNDDFSLKKKIIAKARSQYKNIIIADLLPRWKQNLVFYTEDIIKRVMRLDLKWLYNNEKKDINKCRKELEKIVIGYPEIFSYIDNCCEDIQKEQLLIILHHAVKEITAFINRRSDLISQCAISLEYLDHKKYVQSLINGKKFRTLKTFSESLYDNNNNEPNSLLDLYYYTSSNELPLLLLSLESYYKQLKKAKENSDFDFFNNASKKA